MDRFASLAMTKKQKKAGLSIRPFCIWDVSFARFFSVAI